MESCFGSERIIAPCYHAGISVGNKKRKDIFFFCFCQQTFKFAYFKYKVNRLSDFMNLKAVYIDFCV